MKPNTFTPHKLVESNQMATYNPMLAMKLKNINSAVFLTTCIIKQALKPNEEWFSYTIEDMRMATGLSIYQQKRVVNNLIDKGLINYKVEGMPARRYFNLKWDTIGWYLY